jgi:hypothetical protein
MNRNLFRIATLSTAAAALFAVAATSSAQAATLDNQNLAAPGVYFGTGNSNGAFTVNTENGVEVGLRSKISGVAPQITPTGNTYFIPLGDTFNFDYSVNPNVDGSEVSLKDVTALLTVTNVANGNTFSFDPSAAIFGDATNAAAPGGYQNSEKITFGFLGQNYNPNLDDTFHITLTLSNVPDAGTISVSNTVQVGAGAVPEPATWAMMLVGFGGLGVAMRSRRKQAAATA